MKFLKKTYLILIFISSYNSFAQQIDFKELVRFDTNIINKNSVLNFYWSAVINKKMNFKRITEYALNDKTKDTVKLNTLDFDKEGRLKYWNSVAFRYTGLGDFIGYVDTTKSEIVLPSVINKNAFTDFYFYSELRDVDHNRLVKSLIKENQKADTLKVKYLYNQVFYIKSENKVVDGITYALPEGPKLYLDKILIYRNKDLICERFIKFEIYNN